MIKRQLKGKFEDGNPGFSFKNYRNDIVAILQMDSYQADITWSHLISEEGIFKKLRELFFFYKKERKCKASPKCLWIIQNCINKSSTRIHSLDTVNQTNESSYLGSWRDREKPCFRKWESWTPESRKQH